MKKKSNTAVIEAAGGIVWQETEEERKLALIHRHRYNDWTLPKGKLEPGESWKTAALREVREETGCEVELEGFAGSISYTMQGIPKVVLFWNMKATKITPHTANKEVDEVIWVTREEALRKMSYEIEKNLLIQQTA